MSQTITPGQEVTYQDAPYVVRAVDGNVLELAYQSGGFFRLVHVTSVTVCTPPATQTAASLDAPAAGQGEGTIYRQALQLLDALSRAGLRLGVEGVMLPSSCDGSSNHRSELLVHRLASALSEISQPGNGVLSVLSGNTLQLHADEVGSHGDGLEIDVAQSDGLQLSHSLQYLASCYGKVLGGLVSHRDSLA